MKKREGFAFMKMTSSIIFVLGSIFTNYLSINVLDLNDDSVTTISSSNIELINNGNDCRNQYDFWFVIA